MRHLNKTKIVLVRSAAIVIDFPRYLICLRVGRSAGSSAVAAVGLGRIAVAETAVVVVGIVAVADLQTAVVVAEELNCWPHPAGRGLPC